MGAQQVHLRRGINPVPFQPFYAQLGKAQILHSSPSTGDAEIASVTAKEVPLSSHHDSLIRVAAVVFGSVPGELLTKNFAKVPGRKRTGINAPHPAEQTLEGISGVSIENIFMGLNLMGDAQLKIAHLQSQGRGWCGGVSGEEAKSEDIMC
jgi:hypothetical protein